LILQQFASIYSNNTVRLAEGSTFIIYTKCLNWPFLLFLFYYYHFIIIVVVNVFVLKREK
jgi:hypothetical protein